MGVTIKDVAKKTGLSITTVSLVLNKRQSRISEKTKQIVESAAQELNYLPNQAAISLATKRTGSIALVFPENSHYSLADLLVPTEHACRNAGYGLLVTLVENDDESSLEAINNVLRRGVDGIIFDPSLLGAGSVSKYAELLAQKDAPIVSLGSAGAHIMPNSIVSDHRKGGYLATRHLLELGHRDIGCISGPDGSVVSEDMHNGYRDALEEGGVGADLHFGFSGMYSSQKGEEGARRLLEQGVTAIVSGADVLTRGIYRHVYRAGLLVPDDLSVVGYSDYSQADDMIVPLTTVAIHFDRFARKAVSLIKRLGEKEAAVTPEILPPTLVVRASTGRRRSAPPPVGRKMAEGVAHR